MSTSCHPPHIQNFLRNLSQRHEQIPFVPSVLLFPSSTCHITRPTFPKQQLFIGLLQTLGGNCTRSLFNGIHIDCFTPLVLINIKL